MHAPEDGPRFHIGADENGLGPRLGPMIVTAVMARLEGRGHLAVTAPAKGSLASRLGDSKALVRHGDVALGEAWARALALSGLGRTAYADESPDALLAALSRDEPETLSRPCPSHVAAQCWSPTEDTFLADRAAVEMAFADLEALKRKGVSFVAVRTTILCTKVLNEGFSAGKSRFLLDLHAMERMVVDLQRQAGEEVRVVCGKVGGFAKYGAAFGPLQGRLFSVLEEGRARSVYRFPGAFEIAFVRDADASDQCVAMASLVGKYVREALMARIARHYRALDPSLPDASGYYDPVTAAFVERTHLVRAQRLVPDTCFERMRR